MVFINNILTIIGKIVEAIFILIITIPLIVIIFFLTYLYNIILNLIKDESSS